MMMAPETTIYRTRAMDENGNVYEASVRARSEQEAVAPLRARGLIDAEAVPLKAESPPTEVEARQGWERFVEGLKDLPDGGRPFGRAVEEVVSAASATSLAYGRKGYGLSADGERLLSSVKEAVGCTGRAPDLRAAFYAQMDMQTAWRTRAQRTFIFVGIVLALIGVLWLASGLFLSPLENTRALAREFDLQWALGKAPVSQLLVFAAIVPIFSWVVFISLCASFVAAYLWRLRRKRATKAPRLASFVERVGESWPLLGKVLRAGTRARFLAALGELAESGLVACEAAKIAASLAESPTRSERASVMSRGGPRVASYREVVQEIERTSLGLSERTPTAAPEGSPAMLLKALAESAAGQTTALCARMSTIAVGVAGWLTFIWFNGWMFSTTSPFSLIVSLMTSVGGW